MKKEKRWWDALFTSHIAEPAPPKPESELTTEEQTQLQKDVADLQKEVATLRRCVLTLNKQHQELTRYL